MEKIQKYYEKDLKVANMPPQKQSDRFFSSQKKTKKVVIVAACVIILLVVIVAIYIRRENKQVSKIDMSKPGAHKVTARVDTVYKSDEVESYLQYIEACGQILARYKGEIEFIENMYAKLRKEKLQFMNVEVGNLKKVLEEEGIPSELVLDWIDEIKHNFDDSFAASERVLEDYSLASMEEMKTKIRDLING